MPTVKLIVEYDGTNYAGWQRQPDQPTIQEAIETAIHQLTNVSLAVAAAGRTDAGVHALGQVVSFKIDKPWSPEEWVKGLNARLPGDISVRSAALMPDEFHARYAARGKLYRYRIFTRSQRPAVERAFVWHIYWPLSVDLMREGAAQLVGRRDFTSFEGTLTDNEDPLCSVQRLDLTAQDDLLLIDIYADRFLKHMVRNIVGTLVEVGSGKRPAASLLDVLAAKDRTKAGRTAPAQGLFLMHVDY